ncbi:protein phosphatase 2C 70 [Iris pallida]|uniref:protein-serine/threonine phosphatase n=1 Tax=Iris pallida TaxID=29817 RepID=A0AAX6EQD2_IRIPA|nr:protein phosphatase 2C 70 [Iris pallida]
MVMMMVVATMEKNMALSLGLLMFLLVLLLLLLFLLACRPWRFFLSSSSPSRRSSSSSSSSAISISKNDDIERPLFSESLDGPSGQNYDLARNFVDESRIEIDGTISSPRTHGYGSKKRVQAALHFSQGDSLVLDVVADTSEDSQINHTLKRNAITNWPVKIAKQIRREDSKDVCKDRSQVGEVKDSSFLRSSLTLEVISGPSHGLSCSRVPTNTSMLPLTLGRVSPSDILLNDSEVSGKHAQITWNTIKAKWEMVDLGSLNGTFLNSQAIHHPDAGSRRRSDPVELADGDVITLGTSSKISVQISQHTESKLSYGVGVASDPMSMRRGGKQLPMEDMCYFQCPLPGVEQFGLFGIFDGHGGAGAAKAASKMLPQTVTEILSNAEKRERAVSLCDASDILSEAFSLTEAAITHQYEKGCTATVLLVWIGHNKEVFAQCANVGDSACVISVSGKQVAMTEDHRVVSMSERTRFIKMGMPMKDGETRLCGLNLARMLGDKFLKEQDLRFTAEPYVSQVVHISKASDAAFALLASDGLWDVISVKKAVQLVHQAKEKYSDCEMVAKCVLNEAKALRTKDNTTVIYLTSIV